MLEIIEEEIEYFTFELLDTNKNVGYLILENLMVSLYDEKLINNQLKVEYFSIRSDRDCGEEKWI